jgi:hypothetical protein
MTCSNILNIIGLSLDIIGVLMLFKYGLPPDISKDGSVLISMDFGTKEEKEKRISEGKKYTKLSYTALVFLVGGFISQLIANIIL